MLGRSKLLLLNLYGLLRFSAENLAFTTSDLWTWAVKRIDDELEQDLVKSQGYLEGKTWLDFTNEFITLIDGAKNKKTQSSILPKI